MATDDAALIQSHHNYDDDNPYPQQALSAESNIPEQLEFFIWHGWIILAYCKLSHIPTYILVLNFLFE